MLVCGVGIDNAGTVATAFDEQAAEDFVLNAENITLWAGARFHQQDRGRSMCHHSVLVAFARQSLVLPIRVHMCRQQCDAQLMVRPSEACRQNPEFHSWPLFCAQLPCYPMRMHMYRQ
jgi:hypothetical protein